MELVTETKKNLHLHRILPQFIFTLLSIPRYKEHLQTPLSHHPTTPHPPQSPQPSPHPLPVAQPYSLPCRYQQWTPHNLKTYQWTLHITARPTLPCCLLLTHPHHPTTPSHSTTPSHHQHNTHHCLTHPLHPLTTPILTVMRFVN